MLHQQRLNLHPHRLMVFDTFYDRSDVLQEIQKFMTSKVFGHLQLRGLSQTGKTHVLQSLVAEYQAVYCPLKAILEMGSAGVEGYENAPILCVDDTHFATVSESWQTALEALITARAQNHKITISATENLIDGERGLPSIHQITLSPLGLVDKQFAVQLRAKYLGLKLDDSSAKWLVSRYGENIQTLMKVVSDVDQLSSDAKVSMTPKRLGMLLKQQALPTPLTTAGSKSNRASASE